MSISQTFNYVRKKLASSVLPGRSGLVAVHPLPFNFLASGSVDGIIIGRSDKSGLGNDGFWRLPIGWADVRFSELAAVW